jgi:hypothetical protein
LFLFEFIILIFIRGAATPGCSHGGIMDAFTEMLALRGCGSSAILMRESSAARWYWVPEHKHGVELNRLTMSTKSPTFVKRDSAGHPRGAKNALKNIFREEVASFTLLHAY